MPRFESKRCFARALLAAAAVTVAADVGAQTSGQWAGPYAWPFAASHAVLLANGKVLVWSDATGTTPRIYDPTTNMLTTAPQITTTVANAAHAVLADGDIAIVGGRSSGGAALVDAHAYDAAVPSWSVLPNLAFARDDATCVLLGEGRVLALGGEALPGLPVTTPEIALPGQAWSDLALAQLALPNTPWAFALTNGSVLLAGPDANARSLDTAGFGAWSAVATMNVNGREAGAAVLVPGAADRVLVMGGRNPAIASCEVLDMQLSGNWEDATAMTRPRRHHQATLLADGTVLVTGGTLVDDALEHAVYPAERWVPATGLWTSLASMTVPRRRGSVALLLPDARVLCAGGGDGTAGSELHADAEIFSPPYLFLGARPTITTAPATLVYGGDFTVDSPQASDIDKVWLIRAGSVTRGFNSDQRAVALAFTIAPGRLTITAPANGNDAPPGTYMLFLVDDAGIPSFAKLVRLDVGMPQQVMPDIVSVAPTTATINTPYVYVPSASGTTPITWSLPTKPAWLSVSPSTGSVAGVPTQTGPFMVTLRAANAVGADTQTWTLSVGTSTNTRNVIALGASWRYFKGLTDPGATWATLTYNDAAWLTGPSGFGYGDNDDATVLADMEGNYTTVFTRKSFPLYNVNTVSKISILYQHDDGLAVYLNGTRILAQLAPTTITNTSVATGSHEAGSNLIRADFTNAATRALLVNGTNVLAAVGLNSSLTSGDLTLKVTLEITGGTDTPVDALDTPATVFGVEPNPFRGQVRFTFGAVHVGDAVLEVYDAAGRRVRVMGTRGVAVGSHTVIWDGRDTAGRETSPGVYFYRLRAPGVDRRGKLARTR